MFNLVPFTRADKLIRIDGPDDLLLYVDYDDVDTEAVEQAIPRLLDALNRHDELLNEIASQRATIGGLRTALDWSANCVEAALDYHAQGGAQKGMDGAQHDFRDSLSQARKMLVATFDSAGQ